MLATDHARIIDSPRKSQILRQPIDRLLQLLQRPEESRTRVDLSKLFLHLKENPFFKNLVEKRPMCQVLELISKLKYEFREADEVLFHKGDYGVLFYIILDGEVGVHVPIKIAEEDTENEVEVAQLHTGQSFGELALIYNCQRSASIIAKTVCHFAVLGKDDYAKILEKDDVAEIEKTIRILRKCAIFTPWTQQRLSKLVYYFTPIEVYRNQQVYKEGDKVSYVYIVASGDFKLTKSRKDQRGQVDIAIVSIGEIMGDGESSRMENTCICISSSGSLLRITRGNFYKRAQIQKNYDSWHQYKSRCKVKKSWRVDRFDSIEKFDKSDISQVSESKEIKSPQRHLTCDLPSPGKKVLNLYQAVDRYVTRESPRRLNRKTNTIMSSRGRNASVCSISQQQPDIGSIKSAQSLANSPIKHFKKKQFQMRQLQPLIESLKTPRFKSKSKKTNRARLLSYQGSNESTAASSPLESPRPSDKGTKTTTFLSQSQETGLTIAALMPVFRTKRLRKEKLFKNAMNHAGSSIFTTRKSMD